MQDFKASYGEQDFSSQHLNEPERQSPKKDDCGCCKEKDKYKQHMNGLQVNNVMLEFCFSESKEFQKVYKPSQGTPNMFVNHQMISGKVAIATLFTIFVCFPPFHFFFVNPSLVAGA